MSKEQSTDQYFITINIGYGADRVQWLPPFDSREEAEAYLSRSEAGDWDGRADIEEVLACRHDRISTYTFSCGNCGDHHDFCLHCDWESAGHEVTIGERDV